MWCPLRAIRRVLCTVVVEFMCWWEATTSATKELAKLVKWRNMAVYYIFFFPDQEGWLFGNILQKRQAPGFMCHIFFKCQQIFSNFWKEQILLQFHCFGLLMILGTKLLFSLGAKRLGALFGVTLGELTRQVVCHELTQRLPNQFWKSLLQLDVLTSSECNNQHSLSVRLKQYGPGI